MKNQKQKTFCYLPSNFFFLNGLIHIEDIDLYVWTQPISFHYRKDAKNPWIGFEDRVKAGNFKWIDGSAVAYKYWNNGEPNYIGKERCGHIITDKSGKWNNHYCTVLKPFACKMAAPSVLAFADSKYNSITSN